MLIGKYIEKFATFVKKNKLWLFTLWLIVLSFLTLDGINRNLYQLDLTFFMRGLYNNRFPVLLPLWVVFFLKVANGKRSKLKTFFNEFSLFLFVIALNIYHITEALPHEIWYIYLARFIGSFFVGISVIPFIKKLIKKVDSKESFDLKVDLDLKSFFSKKEVWGLLALTVVFVFARFLSIDSLHPTTDEYLHLREAKNMISPETILFNNGHYTRASFITTTLKWLFLTFGQSLTIARVPGILVSCLTIVLFYLLLRKEDKTLAFISTLLYALSPWSIMLSRTIREYIYFLPLFFLISWYVYKRLRAILEKRYKIWSVIIDISIFLSLVYYSFILDPLSTAKFFVVIYLGAFVYLIYKIAKRNEIFKRIRAEKRFRNAIFFFWGVFVFLVFANKLLGWELTVSQIDIIPSLDLSWIGYIFLNGEYPTLLVGGVFLLFGLVGSLLHKNEGKSSELITYFSIIFLVIVYFFTFHFGRYYRPRYISILLPFVIYLQAYGFTVLSSFLNKEINFTRGRNSILLLTLLNWVYIIYGILIMGTGYVKVTKEFHEGVGLVYEELKDHDEGYVLVTTLPDASDWYWDEDIEEIFHIAYSDEYMEENLDDIVKNNRKGYLVMDTRRNAWAGYIFQPDKNYKTVSGKKLEFYGSVDVYLLYRWEY